MTDAFGGFREAFHLLLSDPGTWGIIGRSIVVSGSAVLIAATVGVPVGALVALTEFPGKRAVVIMLNTGMGLPPVVVGLVVYLLLSRSGPLGFLSLLFTPGAMIAAQLLIVSPIIAALSHSAIASQDPTVRLTALSLGATPLQAAVTVVSEARPAVTAAVIAGFGRAISEVGAVMMVGGNIAHHTRVMTTAIVLETRKGEFGLAIALGIVLLLVSLIVNVGMSWLQTSGSQS